MQQLAVDLGTLTTPTCHYCCCFCMAPARTLTHMRAHTYTHMCYHTPVAVAGPGASAPPACGMQSDTQRHQVGAIETSMVCRSCQAAAENMRHGEVGAGRGGGHRNCIYIWHKCQHSTAHAPQRRGAGCGCFTHLSKSPQLTKHAAFIHCKVCTCAMALHERSKAPKCQRIVLKQQQEWKQQI